MNANQMPADSTGTANVVIVDMKLEVVIIPVSDVDRSKEFYARLGWRLDADFKFEKAFELSSSPRQDQCAQSSSAPNSRRLCQARSTSST